MTTEAIILAGGKGTRLQSVVSDLPKPMAPVRDRPFLEFQLEWLASQGIKRVVLSVGYKHETIESHFGNSFAGLELVYVVEEVPLGTGGGIKLASDAIQGDEFFVLNGDSIFAFDLNAFSEAHQKCKAPLSISLKPMQNFDRYGTVETEPDGRILAFNEKQAMEKGNINAGVYLIRQDLWSLVELPEKFSFETDLMEAYSQSLPFYGFPFEGYFLDIGIPEDYARAQHEFARFEH